VRRLQMNATAAYRLARGMRLRENEDGTGLLLVPEGVVNLNTTATATLALVDGTRDADAIVAALAERFEAQPGELADDVRSLLAALVERGFLLVSQ